MPPRPEILVCNTGPLIALAKIGHVPLLNQLFARVLVPLPVLQELTQSERLSETVWLDAQQHGLELVGNLPPVDPLLVETLDAGEAAVLTLARHIPGSLVLIDERKARRVAQVVYRQPVIGIGGFLLRARQQGLVPRIRPLLQAAVAQGYYISQHLIERLCMEANELQLHEKEASYGRNTVRA